MEYSIAGQEGYHSITWPLTDFVHTILKYKHFCRAPTRYVRKELSSKRFDNLSHKIFQVIKPIYYINYQTKVFLQGTVCRRWKIASISSYKETHDLLWQSISSILGCPCFTVSRCFWFLNWHFNLVFCYCRLTLWFQLRIRYVFYSLLQSFIVFCCLLQYF